MYSKSATRRHPRLVIFMLDQSGSMESNSAANGIPLAKIAADSLNYSLTELVSISTKPKGDDDEEVRDYVKVVIIGYGAEPDFKAQKIYEGYISDIASRPKEKMSTFAGDINLHNIVKPVAGYVTPMCNAFKMAKEEINKWKTEGPNGHAGIEDPSPIVINITDGAPSNERGECTKDALEETAKEAQEIMNIDFPDGPPRIFNIMISQLDGKELLFPNDTKIFENDPFAHFLYLISSDMTDDLRMEIVRQKLPTPPENSKVLIMNTNNPDTLVKIFKTGTIVKMR